MFYLDLVPGDFMVLPGKMISYYAVFSVIVLNIA